MLGVSAFLISTATANSLPRILRFESYAVRTDQATIAELIERPRGIADETFAQCLIDASGLRPWNGKLIRFPAVRGWMGTVAVVSGAGPEVTVYFVDSDSHRAGRVCRITRKYGGMTKAWTSAQDWCAAAFGLRKVKREPPIKDVNVPIKN
jgi:hypothetical protein